MTLPVPFLIQRLVEYDIKHNKISSIIILYLKYIFKVFIN